MARIGGRNAFIAVPAGLVCVAVVGALVWLAAPMGPVVVDWAGEMLRSATSPKVVAEVEAAPAERASESGGFDCRDLYPDGLWAEMTWHGATVLQQTRQAPATAITGLTEALAPNVRVSCGWLPESGGAIVTTLAAVGTDAVPLADAALRGQGFACETTDDTLHCTRTQGDVLEDHSFRGGWWLSTVETAWHPDGYAPRLTAFVWG